MFLPPDQRIRVVHTDGTREWGTALARLDLPAHGEVLKDHAGGTVWAAEVGGERCVVKCLDARGVRRRVQRVFRATPGWRQLEGAAWLAEHGIGTARVRAIVHGRRGGPTVEALVLDALPGRSVLEHLAADELTACEAHGVAGAVGRVTAALLEHGRYNRDHKPSNLMVTRVDSEGADVAIVDTVAIRPVREGHADTAVGRMLANLAVEAIGTGCLPRRAILWRVLRGSLERCGMDRAEMGGVWRGLAEAVEALGDPTPRDNPLPAAGYDRRRNA